MQHCACKRDNVQLQTTLGSQYEDDVFIAGTDSCSLAFTTVVG